MTAEKAGEMFAYDPNSGAITWKVTRNHMSKVGSEAGHLRKSGYRQIIVNGRAIAAHRLAWLLHYGTWPEQHIDHMDGNPSNNRISNLRDVERRVNAENLRGARKDSTCKLLGASPRKDGQWLAQIQVQGRKKHLGLFPTAAEAHAAYLSAKRVMHVGNTL